MPEFSDRLLELRKSHGVTQAQLAKAVSVAQSLIADYEAGNKAPGLKVFIRIADFFGVSLGYLAGKSNEISQ